MPKILFVSNFELHEYVDENSRAKRSENVDCFRTWCLLCFHCKKVRPFNGIGILYGRFVKDFSTHMSLVDCVVFNGTWIHCSHSCSCVLKLLEQLCGAYFEKFLMILGIAFYKCHMHGVVLCLHVVHSGLWTHCSLIFDNLLKLLGQWNEIHFDELGLLVDTPSCKFDVICDEPTLCVEYGLVNLWSSSHLSKNDVSMVPYDLLLLNLENMNLVNRPCLITFEYTHYEDPFLYIPSLVENVKFFVKMFKCLGIASVGMIGPNGNKVLGDYVTGHVNCFYCMSIKPFNGVGMFYGLFVKNFISNGFV